MSEVEDLSRLKQAYAERERRLTGSIIYSPFNPAHLFAVQHRQRAMSALLFKHRRENLPIYNILELGCGRGGVLLELLFFGATPERLHGVDLLGPRLEMAHQELPHLPLVCADGQRLPYEDKSFDLELQFTVFSSLLDDSVKHSLASEMLRVLKPGGTILWYDFWLNPLNQQTRGICPAEIRRLFKGCRFDFNRITLAPPIVRRLVKTSWMFCELLEKIKVFNTHYLVAINPEL